MGENDKEFKCCLDISKIFNGKYKIYLLKKLCICMNALFNAIV